MSIRIIMVSPRPRRDYAVFGKEELFDEFNDPMGVKSCTPIMARGRTMSEAMEHGRKIMQRSIDNYRAALGHLYAGTFIARVDRVVDPRTGKVVYSG